ncbi:replication initiation and membrane attachment family protein [Bacillus sp. 2205SS5-2]|uniref:replication initiation and membrane attachment family protein n=1 Tax=Bacillus sp. 2205SS5-2 TaxID=3109031 RepID=UPI0030040834
MKTHWKELQPVDTYLVKVNGLLHDHHRQVLTFLYQPLIGTECYSLYMTLWAEVERQSHWSESYSHYHLMDFLSFNIQNIYEARVKLEGIGLVKTFVKRSEDERKFIYEIQPPLSPQQFFTDGILNVYLYRKIGKAHFLKLKEFFSVPTVDNNEFQEVTRSFQDIYLSSHTLQLPDSEAEQLSKVSQEKELLEERDNGGLQLDSLHFDMDLLLAGLSESMVPRRAFTPNVKEAITKLSYLYGVDAVQMKGIVLQSMLVEDEIDIESLRKAARDWFQLQFGEVLPKLSLKVSQKAQTQSINEPKTQEEKLIHYLEITSPRELLIDLSNGAEATTSDLQIVEGVIMNQKLPVGVVNVLIHYVMLRTDMKLSKGYVEKIASHWSRKNISTVKEAMDLAKKEHRQYLEWAQGKKGNATSRKKPVRTEKLPDWFEENNSAAENEPKEKEASFDFETEKKKLEEELKKYKK